MEFEGQYLEFDEYEELGGSLDETPFNILEFEARKKINERTLGRLKGIEELPQEVKMCMFALINTINGYTNAYQNSSNKNIASESVGSYSVNYVNGSQIQEIIKSKSIELDDIIRNYLFGVVVNKEHILYLGVK
jgi:hypothetical protein